MLKGWFGEKKTALAIWWGLDEKVYSRYHNIIIPSRNGTAQIDHLLLSQFGLFIVETKNMKGWIFGSEDQAKWTQVLYRQKHSFQNPLRQTFRQKKVLAEFLSLDERLIHTVVFFVGDCQFKTELPPNVMSSRLASYVKSFRSQVLTPKGLEGIRQRLSDLADNAPVSKKEHLASLHERHSSDVVCPKCGSDLVERTAKSGPNAGSRFLGCSSYPKCRFTKKHSLKPALSR